MKSIEIAKDRAALAAARTEQPPTHEGVGQMTTSDMFNRMVEESYAATSAVSVAIPQLEALVSDMAERMRLGGRVILLGAGSSGRYAVCDAAECPPTFGLDPNPFVAMIAGGDRALRTAIEGAEDDPVSGRRDLKVCNPRKYDTVIGVSASGRTPYVIGGMQAAKDQGLLTAGIVCNENTAIAELADYPVEIFVPPAFLAGSTRMGAGTAQKQVLTMISTALMAELGYIHDRYMVNMQLSGGKLIARGSRYLQDVIGLSEGEADAAVAGKRRLLDAIADVADQGNTTARGVIEDCARRGNKDAKAKLLSPDTASPAAQRKPPPGLNGQGS